MKKTGVTMKINLSTTKTGALYMAYQKSRDRVKELEDENKKLKFMIDEGLGWEDMQQDSMQSHIN